jgi:hypothetical protein
MGQQGGFGGAGFGTGALVGGGAGLLGGMALGSIMTGGYGGGYGHGGGGGNDVVSFASPVDCMHASMLAAESTHGSSVPHHLTCMSQPYMHVTATPALTADQHLNSQPSPRLLHPCRQISMWTTQRLQCPAVVMTGGEGTSAAWVENDPAAAWGASSLTRSWLAGAATMPLCRFTRQR